MIGSDGRVSDYSRRASERGVLFDVGHGSGSFSFAAAEAALKEDFAPATISSDIHAYSALGPVFDLPTTIVDSQGEIRRARQKLVPVLTLKRGRIP